MVQYMQENFEVRNVQSFLLNLSAIRNEGAVRSSALWRRKKVYSVFFR